MDIGKVKGDAAWCVFDVDESTDEELALAMKMAGGRISLAVSNPCFELWFLLHYSYVERRLGDCSVVLSELRHHLPRYEKSMDLYDRLLATLDRALENADRLERRCIGLGFEPSAREGNPSTGVHHLVRNILDMPNDGVNK